MATVLAMAMQKGGVGKTTTTLNVGVALGKRGHRVLLVDTDPQANLTEGLGIDHNELEYSIYEVLLNPKQGVGFATIHTEAGVDLVPSTLALAAAELTLAGKVGRELLLREALTAVQGDYDYILIDAPPSLGLFTLNALAAAHEVIVPVQTHVYAFKALPQLEETIDLVRKLNPALVIGGIVCTFTSGRTKLSQAVEQNIRTQYGDLVFTTTIPQAVKLAEAPAAGEPIATYAPHSTGDDAYAALTEELEARYART